MKSFIIAITAFFSICIAEQQTHAAMKATLQGQSYGNTNWVNNNLSGWHELEYLPVRVYLTGGPAANQAIRVDFDHSKGTTPGIQNLSDFVASPNVSFNSGPTLLSPAGDTWSYVFNVTLTGETGWVEFKARLAAGSHLFGGSSLSMSGTPALGVLQIAKPAALPGNPDLAIAKVGPSQANPGSQIMYTLSYTNLSGSTATGVQVVDTLPAAVQFVSGSGGFQQVGNTIIWDLGNVARGDFGSFTYSVLVTNNALNGQTFQNYASILSAENDVHIPNNSASVTTTIMNGCIPPQITSQPQSVQSCSGNNVTLSVLANGSAPLSYHWFKDGELLAGATSSVMTLQNLSGSDAGEYTATISNACGSVTSASASINVAQVVSATPLLDSTNCIGRTATFSTVASGSGPFSYVWYKDGSILPDATGSSLTLPSVGNEDVAIYSVVVSGACNSVTNAASLSLSQPVESTSLADLTRCVGDAALFAPVVSGNGPLTYVWKKNGSVLPGEEGASLLLESITGADAGEYSVEITGFCNTITNTALLVVNEPVQASPLSDLIRCLGDIATFSTTASGTGPFTYVWRRNGDIIAGETNNALVLASVTSADAGLYTVAVVGGCGAVTNSATLSLNQPVSASALQNQTVCEGDSVTFSTSATGAGPLTYSWLKDGIVMPGRTTSSLTLNGLNSSHGGLYSVVVSGQCNAITNSATLTINQSVSGTALVDAAACIGQSATFITVPSGTGPFTYVWRKDGVVLAGATTASLLLSAVVAGDAGTYSVEVTGGCGTYTSSAQLTLSIPVSATPLTNVNACGCDTVSFATTASGTGPFSYTWRLNGNVIPGATAAQLDLHNVKSTDSGVISVQVDGPCSTVLQSATLSVTDEPQSVPGVYQSPGQITINDFGPASPYPSAINVSCLPGTIQKLTVTLHGLSHTFPEDMDMLLVGPNGRGVILMSDAGSDYVLNNVTVTFDDDALESIPEYSSVVPGVYRPTDYGGAETFEGVNSVPIFTSLAAFNGISANGTWSLYVKDDQTLDAGSIQGWSLNIHWEEPKPKLISVGLDDQGMPQFWISGVTNKTHIVEVSTDLQHWTPIATNGVKTVPALFRDVETDPAMQLFYRVYRAQ